MEIREYRGRAVLDEESEYATDIKNGQWVYGSYIDGFIVGKVVEVSLYEFSPEFWISVDPNTVSQYTGLKDKNGTKIFEGDNVRWKISELCVEREDEVTNYNGYYFGECGPYTDTYDLYELCDTGIVEVIGNIWEE